MASNSNSDLEQERIWINDAKSDPNKFAPLYNKYFKQIYLFIFKRVRSKPLAGDISSQVFLKAMLNIRKYKDRGYPFSAWLYRIAVNEVNMYFRKAGKTVMVEIREDDAANIMQDVKPDGQAVRSEQERLMIDALNRLDDEQTEMIELRYFEKLSFREIGAIYGISEGNAKIRTYRILDKIKDFVHKSGNK